MRAQTFPFLAILSSALALGSFSLDIESTSSPFQSAHIVDPIPNLNKTASDALYSINEDDRSQSLQSPIELVRRDQGFCGNGYNSCSTLAVAFANVCCSTTAICSADNVGNVACCPVGSFCTGTINPNTAASITSGGNNVATTTGAGVIVVGGTTTTNVANTQPPTTGVSLSYVPNTYFPFPIIPSSFTGASAQASCLSAYSACASNYGICSADLAGSSPYGVTVVAPGGGGVTVGGQTTALSLGAASASSICASLSSAACHGLATTNCGVPAATGSATGFTIATGAGRRVLQKGFVLNIDVGGMFAWACVVGVWGGIAVML